MSERLRIGRYFAPLTLDTNGVALIGDDAAVLPAPQDKQLVITTDSVIQGIHVLPDATPQQFASKLIRRNLSDLAAMGATPWHYTLNLHTPTETEDAWFEQYAATLKEEQERFGMVLAGGDMTSGAGVVHTTMTCFGLLPAPSPYPYHAGDADNGLPLRRGGAHEGDDIYVSGTLGDAAYALSLLQRGADVSAALVARYYAPEPRIELGQKLRSIASSAIDVSDGLMGDLAALIGYVGARLMREAIPLSVAMQQAVQQDPANWRFALSGGDDYELLFTASPEMRGDIQSLAAQLGLPLTPIGTITDEGGPIALCDERGTILDVDATGWEYR